MNLHDFFNEGVAGPKSCWPGHRKVGTQPGTGKNAGKRVNDCEKIGEGADERKQNALWAQITQHEKAAKATKNDIKKQHHLKMADELRGKLKTSDLKEFAPGNGDGAGRWYTDDQMTDIVGDAWWEEMDVSGDISKNEIVARAQAWLEDQGYSVNVLNVQINDDDCSWYIEGSFYNPRFAKKGVAENYEDEEQDDGFYVAISNEEDGVFVGALTKDGGKWIESTYQGTPPRNWGGGYMSYLTPQDIMHYMHQDYDRQYEVVGPLDEEEVGEYINMMSEGEVVKFPKKHKGDLEDTHDCPKCGGDLQGGTYMGHKVKVCMPCKQVYLPPNSGIDQKGNKIEEGDVAKLAGITALGIGAGLGANYLDQQAPRVEFDGKNGTVRAYLEPAYSNRIPDNAMTIKGKDGKTYHVWSSAGKGANSKSYHAAPVEPVKEGSYTKTPSGDYINQHTGVRSSKPPAKKKRGEKTGAEWDAIEKAKKDKQQGVAEGWDPDTIRLEQDVRDALENGDDYTAKQYAKMAPTPEAKKYLLNIIKQAMYIDDLGGETDWKGVAEDAEKLKAYKRASAGDTINRQNIANRTGKADPKIAKRNAGQERAEKRLQGVAEGEGSDLRRLQQQWWVALPAIMKQAGIDYQPYEELSRDYYPTLGWINIPGERFSTFEVNANPKGDSAKINIYIDVRTSNELYRDADPEKAAELNAFAEKIAQALGGTLTDKVTGERGNHPGVGRITATMQLPKEPETWQNPSRGYDPKARFLNTPGERARQSRAARSGFPDSYGGDSSNYRLEEGANCAMTVEGVMCPVHGLHECTGAMLDEAVSGIELADLLLSAFEERYPDLAKQLDRKDLENTIMDAVELAGDVDTMSDLDMMIDDIAQEFSNTVEPEAEPQASEQPVTENKLYYNVTGTPDNLLRKQFGLRKNDKGWYLNEDVSIKRLMSAFRAFGEPTRR